ncbi:Uma2 family endonuclease [Ornithinimicrobium faecis]|uniref:Uma2 family endonuclease n=1 Tax=Ornithinimicrobium faecis TaxID=2934158 RepID=A0ABY4YWG9_9MICO|nr:MULTISPECIES: Uma2 family endonuclease [unclassified Ornithinimicrobium]USQ81116.1 Uma2 family endonuclease [Ornithinimicrobium sp. HY1793]
MTVTSHPGSLTRADLDALRPAEGSERYELLDGAILVTPGPGRWHQAVVVELTVLLRTQRPDGFVIKTAPFDVALAEDTVLQPDLLVTRREDLTDNELPGAPLLAVEVLSPSTRRIDRLLKRDRFAAAGVPSYWLIDPAEPSVRVLELDGDHYTDKQVAHGDEPVRVTAPFPLEFRPSDLLQE